jgi:hypothetical protein
MAPELLPPLTEEKDAILRLMKTMQINLGTLDKADIRTGIHKLEVVGLEVHMKDSLRNV